LSRATIFPFWEIRGLGTLRLVGLNRLDDFKRSHSLARKTLDAWIIEVKNANWQSPKNIKERFRTADFLSDNRVIFNIKGNSFRLVVKVNYDLHVVLIEWVGTHAEYDRKEF
jgi:mRNA interferase HigB